MPYKQLGHPFLFEVVVFTPDKLKSLTPRGGIQLLNAKSNRDAATI